MSVHTFIIVSVYVCVHIFPAVSSYQFKFNSFPFCTFINTSSGSGKLGSHYPQYIYSFAQYKQSQWFVISSLPTTSAPLLLFALPPQTLHTPLSPPLCDTPSPHCPMASSIVHTAITTHLHKMLLPLITAIIFFQGREGGKGKEGHHSCLFPDGWNLRSLICLSQCFCICVEWTNISSPSTSLFSLNLLTPF